MSPQHMFAGDPFQMLATLAWVLAISTLFTVFAFVNLRRAGRSSALVTPWRLPVIRKVTNLGSRG